MMKKEYTDEFDRIAIKIYKLQTQNNLLNLTIDRISTQCDKNLILDAISCNFLIEEEISGIGKIIKLTDEGKRYIEPTNIS